ncbi:MAG: lamin tail domain-containing protein [bacterium]|nr:lamin tail domain-containing protein [bacterium]
MSIFSLLQFIFIADGSFSILPMAASDSTPFIVRVEASGLIPDSIYRFTVYAYGGEPRVISERWTTGKWKGGYAYTDFSSDNSGNWNSWVPLRVIEEPEEGYNYYIKFKVKKGSDDVFESSVHFSDGFQILDMFSQGGWLTGTVYLDSNFTTPGEAVVVMAKDSQGYIIGAYVTENNTIDEGNLPIPGRFCMATPAIFIEEIEFEDISGNPVIGWVGTHPPWYVLPGDTTWVDPFSISIQNISFIPETPNVGDSVVISVLLYNPREAIQNIEIKVTYEKGEDSGEIGSIGLDSIPGHSHSANEILWKDLIEGNYKIRVQVTAASFSVQTFKWLKVGLGNIVLNEVMYNPINSGEWVELINRGTNTVNIKNWSIEDNTTKSLITSDDCFVESGGFVVIAESTGSVLHSIYGSFPSPVFELGSKFPNLKNEGDTIMLRDSNNTIQDLLGYKDDWGSEAKGVTLERINPNLATNNPDNWGSCVIATGGTPGKVNSIYVEYLLEKATLYVHPKIFSPENPDSNVAFISYTLPFTKAKVRLYIYDRCGRCVRKLVDGEPSGVQSRWTWEKGEATWSHIWNGKGDDGNRLPMGIYIVYLEAKDQYSDKLVNEKTTVVIAKRLSR